MAAPARRLPGRAGADRPQRPRLDAAPQSLDELSRSAVRQALENCRGNVTQAARMLGISRQTLYRKLAQDRAADGLRLQ